MKQCFYLYLTFSNIIIKHPVTIIYNYSIWGDLDYKNYRLEYLKINLSDNLINIFQYVSFYLIVAILIVQLIKIFYLIKKTRLLHTITKPLCAHAAQSKA